MKKERNNAKKNEHIIHQRHWANRYWFIIIFWKSEKQKEDAVRRVHWLPPSLMDVVAVANGGSVTLESCLFFLTVYAVLLFFRFD